MENAQTRPQKLQFSRKPRSRRGCVLLKTPKGHWGKVFTTSSTVPWMFPVIRVRVDKMRWFVGINIANEGRSSSSHPCSWWGNGNLKFPIVSYVTSRNIDAPLIYLEGMRATLELLQKDPSSGVTIHISSRLVFGIIQMTSLGLVVLWGSGGLLFLGYFVCFSA